MEAAITAKLHMVSLMKPPSFLPQHIATESSMCAEGREAEVGYGSRTKRGVVHLRKAREEAAAKTARDARKQVSSSVKLVEAQELKGGSIFTGFGGDHLAIMRQLEPGERLSWNHVLGMGNPFEEWTRQVDSNQVDLRWSAPALERQIVLINCMEKD
jgi:hypothetical protein